ncbi:MarR family winged helix-turn-helix transcriptional regulator [Komagataeibacter sp. FNDCF1]|uniref:MarR family winged helix-turn-helix transcriptional regulator n=1 Tax=Komagataeibacter sp. FNDCF1 TaxID=2878681 RepID=UPI0021069025|nr:MarR family winged helix-turn-helix transcriptional regulator [Komagataeibacter sp. FNDCF1]MCE2563274.1 MarR family winged helix-turn-helix transcriptional regulator [Komagataeibacter sp. FNDCF1]
MKSNRTVHTPDALHASGADEEWTGNILDRPGFLIRRLHQIHVSLFIEECGAFDITPVQYSIMSMVELHPGKDQNELGLSIGVDRATLANVVARLEKRALLKRENATHDRRVKQVYLTAQGRDILAKMAEPARRAHSRTIEALPDDARTAFIQALLVLTEAGNAYSRAPVTPS